VGAVALSIGLAAKWLSLPYFAVWGIAGSTSFYIMLSAITMACLLASKTNHAIFAGCMRTFISAAFASLIACAVCLVPYTFSIGRTWLAAPLGAITYVAVLWLMRDSDARQLLQWCFRVGKPSSESPSAASLAEGLVQESKG
jgi:hypothetical protein